MFEIEEIPDRDKLYYRVQKNWIRDGRILPGAIRERGEGENRSMSTDWEKYSTAKESQDRARTPKDNTIVSFIVGFLREETLLVTHAPTEEIELDNGSTLPANQAHTDVKSGQKKIGSEEIRLKLLEECNVEIRFEK
tara:strand:+ start:748 stop:1158 length:411 start_codon:yes stop_codon:yes gene_type:complete